MDDPRRSWAKALTWQATGLVTMTGLGLWFTGSVGQGAALALSSTAIGFACYVLHERVWERIEWGRRRASPVRVRMLGAAATEPLPRSETWPSNAPSRSSSPTPPGAT
jgi:uncharacterized membrane protein